ncbi:MAG: hypothetical protein KC503_00620 [Myxococcales bacterium]|nr:hypothetical protein [Myxococcales bacterium]
MLLAGAVCSCNDTTVAPDATADGIVVDATVDLPDLTALDQSSDAPADAPKPDQEVVVGGSCITRPCANNGECQSGMCEQGACVSCRDNAHCSEGPKQCNKQFGICVECSSDAHCTAKGSGPTKCGGQGACICDTDAHCMRNGQPVDTGKCHNGACIGCTADGDCKFAGSPFTRCFNGRCVACLDDNDCSSVPGTGKCNGVNSCFGCSTVGDCALLFASPLWQCK